MNKAILMGRLTRDPEIRYSNGPEQTAVGRFTLAVDRRGQRQGNQQNADFIPCVAFGKKAEFVEKGRIKREYTEEQRRADEEQIQAIREMQARKEEKRQKRRQRKSEANRR